MVALAVHLRKVVNREFVLHLPHLLAQLGHITVLLALLVRQEFAWHHVFIELMAKVKVELLRVRDEWRRELFLVQFLPVESTKPTVLPELREALTAWLASETFARTLFHEAGYTVDAIPT